MHLLVSNVSHVVLLDVYEKDACPDSNFDSIPLMNTPPIQHVFYERRVVGSQDYRHSAATGE